MQCNAININPARSSPSPSGEGLGRGERRFSHSENDRLRLRSGGVKKVFTLKKRQVEIEIGRGEKRDT